METSSGPTMLAKLRMNGLRLNGLNLSMEEKETDPDHQMEGFTKGHRRTPSDAEFREITLRDARESLHKELEKLIVTAKPEEVPMVRKEFDGFERLFARFLQETGPSVDWEKIKLLPDGAVKPYSELSTDLSHDVIRGMLNKLVVLKLNGGLGTSMGCTGPKSLISVRNELTFLDLNVQQIENLNKSYNADVPLVLMNSFNTDEDTEKILRKYAQMRIKIDTFNQSRYPRINRESLLPISKAVGGNENEGWYPPGHGDIYESLSNSGLLEKYIKEGKEYIFISNIDNLGATVDLQILSFLLNPKNGPAPEFVMEVTDKTRADVKGGTLVEYEGTLRLLEIAQVPKDRVDEFKSVSKFKIFNTNNLWIGLNAMKRVVDANTLDLEIIVNPKTLDNGTNVIQLETAVGAAIKCFDGSIGINVPRRRFLPVKTTSDLLIIMSNLYSLKQGFLEMNPKRSFPSVPLTKLGTSFKKVKDFLSRFASIPDLLELDHLTVSGDVTFGKGVSLKTLDNGTNVIQLETAVGAAIKCFDGSIGINVPRRRFLPVKTTSDLLIIMSNLYSLKQGFLEMNPKRSFPSVPLTKLGTSFKKVKDFLSRFASIPDLLELDHLTVSGDVTFGKGVSLKTLDNGTNVIQLETAVGAAIKCFDGSIGINVPRRRFLPVKTTSDLLIIMSNLYSLKQGFLEMNPKRSFPSVPLTKLGTSFKKVKDFLSRFASIPDLLELDHLTVSGDVTFGKGVSLKGTVIIIANHGERIDIPPGAILENKIVSGNLRIMDH